MSAEDPIPENLADAFGEMVLRYDASDWTPDDPYNPRVFVDRNSYDFASLCTLIEGFHDPLPDDLLAILSGNIHYGNEDLEEDLAINGSYSSAARVLRLLMQRRKEEFRKREEARRARK